MVVTTAILATAGIEGGITYKSERDHHKRRKRERKLREENERN